VFGAAEYDRDCRSGYVGAIAFMAAQSSGRDAPDAPFGMALS
jgi:hypothetical protein